MEFWKASLSVGGIGAVGAFVLYNLYKEWLTLPVLDGLTKNQRYSLICSLCFQQI